METEPWAKLEEADRQLFALHNKLSLLEYERDRGDVAAADGILEVHATIRSLLGEASLLAAVRACQAAPGIHLRPETTRKAALLERAILFSAVENDSALRRAIEAVRSRMSGADLDCSEATSTLVKSPARSTRREALARTAGVSAAMEPLCRQVAALANRAARGAGYHDYAQAKLTHEEMTPDGLRSLFRQWSEERKPQWTRLLRTAGEASGGAVQACDLLHLLGQYRGRLQNVFAGDKMMPVLRELLAKLGIRFEKLPISIEFRDIPYSGSCHRVMPGRDLRILLKPNLIGFQGYFYLLHEFGHAIYYCHCPIGSELLIDDHPAREIMADMWTCFLKQEHFIVDIMGLPSPLAVEAVRVLDETETLRLFLYLRDAVFGLEVLQDPATPLSETWRAVSNEWLGIDDNSGAFDLFDFLHPLDMKSYVLAQVLSERAFASLAAGHAGGPVTPVVFGEMIDRFYRPGNMITWRTKFGV